MKKKLHRSILSEAARIVKLSKRVSPDFDETTIHEMRTRIKKIRALLRWEGSAKNIFTDRFKEMYRAAGAIRDPQLMLKEISSGGETLPRFSLWLANGIGNAERQWDQSFTPRTARRWLRRVRKFSGYRKLEPSKTFYRHKTRELQKIVSGPLIDDESIHDGRKLIKDMQYVSGWEKESAGRKPGLSLKKLKAVSDAAGDYMDLVNALQYLMTYIRKEKDKEARNAAAQVFRQWETEKKNRRRKVVRAMRSLRSSF